MATYNRLPVAFASGSGAWLVDQHGERYLDALSGISVCGLGHSHPAVTRALSEQVGLLLHTSNLYQIPLQEQLAGRLCELSGLDKVFFANSGAEANETAIKLCRKYAYKKDINSPVIVVMDGSFHGRTMATLTATGNDKVKEGFAPLLPGFQQIPYNDIKALHALTGSAMDIVAVMLEPVQGEGGINIPAPGYLKAVSEICSENEWLLVLDEIQTGLCRTGKWFAWQYEEAKPDIMTLAKALGNGVPIGACLATDKVAAALLAGSHGSTFGGNPLASRAGLVVLDYMTANSFDQRAQSLGEEMLSHFKQLLGQLPGVKEVRGRGLMIGIELHADCPELVARALHQHLLINVTNGNVVRLLPPLIISDAEAEQIVTRVSDLIVDYLAG
ncbi:MAG: aspartate aminotransferase family protein [Gammaproteobacteria bacterium]